MMENITEEVLVPSSYIDSGFRQCDEISDIPSECLLLQSDVITNIEDAFLHMNILKQESDGLCSDQHSYFTTVSTFGDFISFSGDLVHKNDHCDASEFIIPYEENVISENVQEVVVEEVAEQEIASDSLDFSSCYDKIVGLDQQNCIFLNEVINSISVQHPCDFCDRKFSKKSLLRRHQFLHHSQRPSFECSECGATFSGKKMLISHLKRNHNNKFQECRDSFLETSRGEGKFKNKITKRDKNLKSRTSEKIFERFRNKNNNCINPEENGYPFMCVECHQTFDLEKDLLKHVCVNQVSANVCLVGASHQCKTCFDIFVDEKSLRYHRCSAQNKEEPIKSKKSRSANKSMEKTDCILRKETIKNRYSCDQCDHKCESSRDLNAHVHQHKNTDNVPCLYCQKLFTNRATVVEHLYKKHNVIPDDFVCMYCGKRCKDFRGLQKHSSVHSDGQFLICNVCEKQFYTRTRLKRHMNSHRDKAVTCEECGEKVPDNRALANHRASHNLVPSRNGELATRIFPCHACNKVFGSRSSQQIHMRVHTGERPYNCRFCVKAFADGGTLRKHERIHTGEKPYACPVCGKAFNQRVVLREHIRAHHANVHSSNGGHNKCEVCAMVFNTPQELCTHLVKHSDENTAKHRVPLAKPRKYKKWKVKPLEDHSGEKRFSRPLPLTKCDDQLIKLEREEDASLIFQNNSDVTLDESILKHEQNQSVKVNKLDDFREVRLFMSESNDGLLPFSNNESENKKWKNSDSIDSEDKIFTIGVSYQLMNQFVDKLPGNHSKGKSDGDEIDNNSCLNFIQTSDDKNDANDVWFALKERYEFSFDSDLCVHSGLGLGATVELQSEF